MQKVFILILMFSACSGNKSSEVDHASDDAAIRLVLSDQVTAWNEGNLEKFMTGYYRSDSILFIGRKITSGWDSTLLRYKRGYPDLAAMGKLRFEILQMDFIAPASCLVTGKYFLTREKDNPSGIFTLLFKKKKGQWAIVYDHTS